MWIVLLRGVNVGGHNKLVMADVRDALNGAGFERVRTYIQSGNIVLTAQGDADAVTSRVKEVLNESFGLDVQVFTTSKDALVHVIAANPFDGDPSRVMVYFCFEPLTDFDAQPLQDLAANGEQLKVSDTVIYLHAPDGIGRSKLAGKMDRTVPVQLSARNLRTVQKLVDMATSS